MTCQPAAYSRNMFGGPSRRNGICILFFFSGVHVYSIGKYTIRVDLMVYEKFTLIPITKTEN